MTDNEAIDVVEMLTALPGNSVVYSDGAWAVARKAYSGDDRWFPDHGSWQRTNGLNSGEMKSWTRDWVVLR